MGERGARGHIFDVNSAQREALWLLAQCAEKRKDFDTALLKLKCLEQLISGSHGSASSSNLREVSNEIARVNGLRRRAAARGAPTEGRKSEKVCDAATAEFDA